MEYTVICPLRRNSRLYIPIKIFLIGTVRLNDGHDEQFHQYIPSIDKQYSSE